MSIATEESLRLWCIKVAIHVASFMFALRPSMCLMGWTLTNEVKQGYEYGT